MSGKSKSENFSTNFFDLIINERMDESTSEWDIEFRDCTRFWVQHVMVPIVLLVGLIGNIVTIFILTRRTMRSTSNVYLTSLAFSDLMYLIFSFSMSWKHYKFMDSAWLYWKYIPLGLWITDASCSTSIWLTVAFTIERYIAVCYPMLRNVYCTEERAKFTTIVVYIVCFLLTASTPFEWKSIQKPASQILPEVAKNTIYVLKNTELGENILYRFCYNWMTILVFVIIPFFLLSILNFLLIDAVQKSRSIRESLTPVYLQNQLRLQTMRKEDKLTVTLISVVIMFLVCQIPTATVLIYTAMNKPAEEGSFEENILLGLGNICNFLVTFNAACNFLLYTALSDKYRAIFVNIVLFKWSRLSQHVNHTRRNVQNGHCINNNCGQALPNLQIEMTDSEHRYIKFLNNKAVKNAVILGTDKQVHSESFIVEVLDVQLNGTRYLPLNSSRLCIKHDVHSV